MSHRKIKDAVDLTNDELIYFRSHAKATFMSDGKTVENAIQERITKDELDESTEVWTFTLADGSTVTKNIVVRCSEKT